MVRSFSVKSNDYMYVVYISNLIRSILALHDLINNKINNKEVELARAKKEKEDEELMEVAEARMEDVGHY